MIWKLRCDNCKKNIARSNYPMTPESCDDCGAMTRLKPKTRLDAQGRPYHPAKFSKNILVKLGEIIFEDSFVLDPFAGTGLIHSIPGIQAWGVEIEPEWAEMHHRTVIGDATRLPFRSGSFPYVVTSCGYGNRMSDHHNAKDKSVRNTYKHSLGRDLHPNNSCAMHFHPGRRGKKYRVLHRAAWREVHRVLTEGGIFILNVSNFLQDGEVINVAGWHKAFIKSLGFELIERHEIETRRHKQGANRELRTPHEFIYVFRRTT